MSSSTRRHALMASVAGAAALAGAGLAWWRLPALAPQAAGADDAALAALWALRLQRPDGGELVLADLRGKPLLLNFWATWCPPCVKEMPEINRFYQAWAAKGWQVLGLAIDSPTPVRNFLAKVKVDFPIGLAGLDGTALVRSLGNPSGGLPFSVLVGAQGRVLQRTLGETNFDELVGWADQA